MRALICILSFIPLAVPGQQPPPYWLEHTKKDLIIKISIPEGNFLYLNKGYKYGSTFGFLGISTGFEYYISNKININMDMGALMDFMFPFPAPVDAEGEYDKSFAYYADVGVGTNFNRFHFDAGLQFTRTSYNLRETVTLAPVYQDTLIFSKKQNNIGLAVSGSYRMTRKLSLGVNYYPSFIAWSKESFGLHYGHLLFFELIFPIGQR